MIGAIRRWALITAQAFAIGFWALFTWLGAMVVGHYIFVITKPVVPDYLAALMGLWTVKLVLKGIDWATGATDSEDAGA